MIIKREEASTKTRWDDEESKGDLTDRIKTTDLKIRMGPKKSTKRESKSQEIRLPLARKISLEKGRRI